jgi:hypothetical protein
MDEPPWTMEEVPLPSWLQEPQPNAPGLDEEALRDRLQQLRTVTDPDKLAKAEANNRAYLEKKAANAALMADPARVRADLADAGLSETALDLMKNGDPDHGGQRLPLGFESYDQLQAFQDRMTQAMATITVGGQPVTYSVQVMGSSTTFYSGNPDLATKPVGYHFDSKGPGSSDYDIDIVSPELVKMMLQNPDVPVNQKNIRDGMYVNFSSNEPGGFLQTFPQFAAVAAEWKQITGRDFEFKLKMDLTPIADQPPMRSDGPIEVLRKG